MIFWLSSNAGGRQKVSDAEENSWKPRGMVRTFRVIKGRVEGSLELKQTLYGRQRFRMSCPACVGNVG